MVTLTQKCQVTIPNKKKKVLPFDKWKVYLGVRSTDKAMEELR